MAANNNTHVLVTGGAGFIGSHIVDILIEHGYAVSILDNLEPPTHNHQLPGWINKEASFILGDVRNKEDWKRALQGVDMVIHLAAYMDYHLDFSTYVDVNIKSLSVLYECIVENNLPTKKIVAASSQSVYGEGKYVCDEHGTMYVPPRAEKQLLRRDWEQHCPKCHSELKPVPESEDDQLFPEIPYAISKWTSERFLKTMGMRYGIPSVSARYSIVLGPNQSFRHYYSGALRAFVANVLNHEPIQMNEDGRQIRDFVHVKDVARAHVFFLEEEQANFEDFNVGSGRNTRVIELAESVAKIGGVEFGPICDSRYRVGGARHSLMSIEKLKSLGWEPLYTLDQAVADYFEWIKHFDGLSEILKNTELSMKKFGLMREL